ncbi:hypothetical protein GF386_01465 [Candidatus Pacearchaeota archaeon]|nr:hypothetical protein [Candidatus Pacearchaeota archaeon]MBD3282851.1 hypothetical protein [Candidatus Pacearchaeota archaeon]
MNKNNIKIAFSKVKEDMNSLRGEIYEIKSELDKIKNLIKDFTASRNSEKTNNLTDDTSVSYGDSSTDNNSTLRQINSTDVTNSTNNSTVPREIEGLKYPNFGISTGNEGVSTDRQTDTSTDTSTQKKAEKSIEHNIKEASEILNSLDRLRKEIRLKFKRVTPQEMAVFSSIYQIEEQDPDNSTYKYLSNSLKLSESSIRDYVQRMINKGIPIKKQKIDNKKILLSISSELKNIATLPTIIKLREL